MKLIPRNETFSGDSFGYTVALSGNRAIIGAYLSDEKGYESGAAYIFHRVNVVWKEDSKILPTDGSGSDWFGGDVALYGDTATIGCPSDDDMGSGSGSV